MDRTLFFFMRLIKSTLVDEMFLMDSEGDITPKMLEKVFQLSKKHDLTHLVGIALRRTKVLQGDPSSRVFSQAIYRAILRYEKMNRVKEQIFTILEEKGIDFMPLKGAVIRQYYPEPWMRTSCDIDIHVKKDRLEKTVNVLMQNLGLRLDKRGSHDVTLITSNGVRVELHFDLIERIKYPEIAKILMNIWETSSLMDNSNHHYIMSERVFYFYHIAHMAKHFENGGCGIRPFVDLWILHRKGFDGDELLEKGGLKAFENACLRLVHVWFCGERHDETTRMLEAYIIEGGVYGSLRNRVGVQQNKQGGKLRYLMSRIFLPYHILMHQYPALQKRRHLVPVYQVIRWLQIVFRGKIKKGLYELNASRNVSDEQDSVMSDLLLRLGLK